MKKGQCKLCLKTKNLCRESHIIPKFLYKLLKGENNLLIFVNNEQTQRRYNGEYESNILCESCDSQIIGKLEDYVAKFMYNQFPKSSSRLESVDGIEYLIIEGDVSYDYKKYKLFLASLLWRSSISSRPFFQQIKLSSKDEDSLRNMILNSEPGDPDLYTCFLHLPPLVSLPKGSRGFDTLYMPTMSPMMIKMDGWEICKFVIQGMSFYFLISMPPGTKVEPSVEINRLSFKISTLEEQSKLLHSTLEMVRNHQR